MTYRATRQGRRLLDRRPRKTAKCWDTMDGLRPHRPCKACVGVLRESHAMHHGHALRMMGRHDWAREMVRVMGWDEEMG